MIGLWLLLAVWLLVVALVAGACFAKGRLIAGGAAVVGGLAPVVFAFGMLSCGPCEGPHDCEVNCGFAWGGLLVVGAVVWLPLFIAGIVGALRSPLPGPWSEGEEQHLIDMTEAELRRFGGAEPDDDVTGEAPSTSPGAQAGEE